VLSAQIPFDAAVMVKAASKVPISLSGGAGYHYYLAVDALPSTGSTTEYEFGPDEASAGVLLHGTVEGAYPKLMIPLGQEVLVRGYYASGIWVAARPYSYYGDFVDYKGVQKGYNDVNGSSPAKLNLGIEPTDSTGTPYHSRPRVVGSKSIYCMTWVKHDYIDSSGAFAEKLSWVGAIFFEDPYGSKLTTMYQASTSYSGVSLVSVAQKPDLIWSLVIASGQRDDENKVETMVCYPGSDCEPLRSYVEATPYYPFCDESNRVAVSAAITSCVNRRPNLWQTWVDVTHNNISVSYPTHRATLYWNSAPDYYSSLYYYLYRNETGTWTTRSKFGPWNFDSALSIVKMASYYDF